MTFVKLLFSKEVVQAPDTRIENRLTDGQLFNRVSNVDVRESLSLLLLKRLD